MTDHFVEVPKKVLSPAAQAVRDAYIQGLATKRLSRLAAALRAAADQVVPEQAIEDVPGRFVDGCCHAQRQNIRAELFAIAAELEAQP